MASEIEQLLSRFALANDIPIESANRIEVALGEAFPDDDFVQQTVEMLAMYRPGGGEFLFDTDAVRKRLHDTLVYLQAIDHRDR